MTGTEFLERFSKIPLVHRVAALLLICALLGVVFYFLFYSEVEDEAVRLQGKIAELEQEKANYEEKQRKYNSLRAEVHKLLEEQKEQIKVLPTDSEIPSFLQSIHAKGELAGLNILTFEQQPEVQQNFYAVIPVKMIISGSFHQINKFFYSVGKLKRIVNIKDLQLQSPVLTEGEVILQASFMASTFRFLSNQPANTGGQGQGQGQGQGASG